jgi:hypothetical protein
MTITSEEENIKRNLARTVGEYESQMMIGISSRNTGDVGAEPRGTTIPHSFFWRSGMSRLSHSFTTERAVLTRETTEADRRWDRKIGQWLTEVKGWNLFCVATKRRERW